MSIEGKCSLLLDESTDISVTIQLTFLLPLLGLAIIYFDFKLAQVVTTFLTLTELQKYNSAGIAQSVKDTLSSFNLPVENLVGIGWDR